MRFELLSLQIPGDEYHLRFSPRLTVLSGIGVLERRALVDSVFAALVGGPGTTTLTYLDEQGRTVRAGCDRGHLTLTDEDGCALPPLTEVLGKTPDELRALMRLAAGDLGLTGARSGEPTELAEARATLTALTDEMHAAYSARQTTEAMATELSGLDERIRVWEENRARRQYAGLLADLERVRAEFAALRTGRAGIEADRALITSAAATRRLGASWRTAATEVAELREAFGDADRLDARTLDEGLRAPHEVPEGIDALVVAVEDAEAERVALSVRLREMAASRLPEPSTPFVTELARLDQDLLWEANTRVLAAAAEHQAQSMALGGVGGTGDGARIVADLERIHEEVDAAEEKLTKSWTKGALGAKKRLALAQEREQEALVAVGAPSWLAFHLRRVDAMLDPNSRGKLELAALQHRVATAAWAELAGDLDPAEAADAEVEVRAYASSLRDLGEAAEEIEAVRDLLLSSVEPRVTTTRAALLAVLEPFGIDDAFLAAELVRHQVATGHVARVQSKLEQAEAVEASLRNDLEGIMRPLGFGEGDLSARVGAFEWSVTRATEREHCRAFARDPVEVEAQLEKLEDEARRTRRPEWAGVVSTEADEPDVEQLLERRASTAVAYDATRSLVPDLGRLVDRHAALGRRVAVLESSLGAALPVNVGDSDSVRQYLLARLTSATSASPGGGPLPVVVDDALARLPGDAKWELLDLLERSSERTQLVYLTDDPYVQAWARRRAGAGTITLLEPVAEPV